MPCYNFHIGIEYWKFPQAIYDRHVVVLLSPIGLGPLCTRAMSRDHKIVRAQTKVSNGTPKTPPKSCSVVTGPQVQCEIRCDRALNRMLGQCISIRMGPHAR